MNNKKISVLKKDELLKTLGEDAKKAYRVLEKPGLEDEYIIMNPIYIAIRRFFQRVK